MGTTFVIAWLALGFIVSAVLLLAQRSLLGRRRATGDPAVRGEPVPGVSVLKPMRGADTDLEANLTTIFRQDHPRYEVLLGVADADDPAIAVARRVAAAHPEVPSQIVVDARRVGLNPKVNNLANLARVASHDVLVVSDSNVAVGPTYVSDLAARLAEPGVGLVSSPIRARPTGTLGAALESLQINTYVMGGVAAITLWFRGVCCVGKSMAFRRADLESIGGFPRLARHLAEDQFTAEELSHAGRTVTVASLPVDNVLGALSVRDFCARHVRWARIRRWMSPGAYASELLGNPVACAALGFVVLPSGPAVAAAAALFVFRAACDAAMERRIGVHRRAAQYVPLLLLKESLILALWPVPWFDRTVTWRGNRFVLGPRTLLSPARDAASAASEAAPVAGPALDFHAARDPATAPA